jgi:hypothetical protein
VDIEFDFVQFCMLSDEMADYFTAADLSDPKSLRHLVAFAPDAVKQWESRILAAIPSESRKDSYQLFRLMPFKEGLACVGTFQTAHGFALWVLKAASDYLPQCEDTVWAIGDSLGIGRSAAWAEALRRARDGLLPKHERNAVGIVGSWNVERSKALANALRDELGLLEAAFKGKAVDSDDFDPLETIRAAQVPYWWEQNHYAARKFEQLLAEINDRK